eukprot:16068970-Heterocapsa_arctica.AAC.1
MAPHDLLSLALDLTAGFNSERAFLGLVEDQEGHGVAVVLGRDHRQHECEHPDPTRHGPRIFGRTGRDVLGMCGGAVLCLEEEDRVLDLLTWVVPFDHFQQTEEDKRPLEVPRRVRSEDLGLVHLVRDLRLLLLQAFGRDLDCRDGVSVVEDEGQTIGVEVDPCFISERKVIDDQ